jgi:uncharacterized protein YggU (UPF0235/DUF167 family)
MIGGAVQLRKDKPGHLQINLHVKPGAKITRVAEITDECIALQVAIYCCNLHNMIL